MARKNGAAPAFLREMVEHPDYQKNLQTRLHAGILPPNMEIRLLEYVYGKPAEEIDLHLHQDYASKSTDELLAIAATLQEELKQLQEQAQSIH